MVRHERYRRFKGLDSRSASVLKRPHMWLLSLLYLATFGSFIGFPPALPCWRKAVSAVDILKLAFFGPFIGALAHRSAGSSPTVSAACG